MRRILKKYANDFDSDMRDRENSSCEFTFWTKKKILIWKIIYSARSKIASKEIQFHTWKNFTDGAETKERNWDVKVDAFISFDGVRKKCVRKFYSQMKFLWNPLHIVYLLSYFSHIRPLVYAVYSKSDMSYWCKIMTCLKSTMTEYEPKTFRSRFFFRNH